MKFVDIHTHAIFKPDLVQIRDLSSKYTEEMAKLGYFSLGIHPWFVQEDTLLEELQKIEAKIGDKAFLAIGECGLDKACKTNFDLQLKAFQMQIELSEKFKKPIILHVVKAFNELIKLRQELKSKQPWIVHGFNGSPQLAKQLNDLGVFVSFGIQLKNQNSKAAKTIPGLSPQSFFLETDNAEITIQEIYSLASRYLGLPIELLQSRLWLNFEALFL